MNNISITNECNMALMRRYPDKYFDLAIVDPPYGIGAENHAGKKENGWKQWDKKNWDIKIPEKQYFTELFRVSKNQIIWGGNYMTEFLPPSPCWIFWDKGQRDFSLADGELSWTSFNKALRVFEMPRASAMQQNNSTGGKIHPTQKPVKLYEWLLMNYAKEGDKILDTHGGSMSIALAVHNMNVQNNMKLSLDICELDTEYYEQGKKRYLNHIQQKTIFDI